jgi:hypothetical protein
MGTAYESSRYLIFSYYLLCINDLFTIFVLHSSERVSKLCSVRLIFEGAWSSDSDVHRHVIIGNYCSSFLLLTYDENQNCHTGISLDTRDFTSVRLPIQDVTYCRRCFRRSLVSQSYKTSKCIEFPSSWGGGVIKHCVYSWIVVRWLVDVSENVAIAISKTKASDHCLVASLLRCRQEVSSKR